MLRHGIPLTLMASAFSRRHFLIFCVEQFTPAQAAGVDF
jgi:hypothetical protein